MRAPVGTANPRWVRLALYLGVALVVSAPAVAVLVWEWGATAGAGVLAPVAFVRSGGEINVSVCGGSLYNDCPGNTAQTTWGAGVVFVGPAHRFVVDVQGGPLYQLGENLSDVAKPVNVPCSLGPIDYPGTGAFTYSECAQGNQTLILVFDWSANRLVRTFAIPGGASCGWRFAVDPSAGVLYCPTSRTSLELLNTTDGSVLVNVTTAERPAYGEGPIAYDPVTDTTWLGVNGSVDKLDPTSGKVVGIATLPVTFPHPEGIGIDGASDRLIVTSWGGANGGEYEVTLFDLGTLRPTGNSTLPFGTGEIDPLIDEGRGLAFLSAAAEVDVINASSGSQLGVVDTNTYAAATAYDPNDRALVGLVAGGDSGYAVEVTSTAVVQGIVVGTPFETFQPPGVLFPAAVGVAVLFGGLVLSCPAGVYRHRRTVEETSQRLRELLEPPP